MTTKRSAMVSSSIILETSSTDTCIDDEALRWSDLKFFRLPQNKGIAVKLFFRYMKGGRGMFAKPKTRTFTIMPANGDQYELDLALLLTAMAFSRGLFVKYKTAEVSLDLLSTTSSSLTITGTVRWYGILSGDRCQSCW